MLDLEQLKTIKKLKMHKSVNEIELLDIPKIADIRGNLAVIEKKLLSYKIERVYFLYDVPSDSHRGGHAHKEQMEFLIPVSGSFDVILDDGTSKKVFSLNKPNKGLLIPTGMWRELGNFSSGSVCLVLSSAEYLEDDYIRSYDEYLQWKRNQL